MAEVSERSNYTLKDEICEYWSGRAAGFDHSPSHKIDDEYGTPEWHGFVRSALSLGDGGRLDGKAVLDVACGTGEISRTFCGLGAKVTGVDFSQNMLDIARAKLAGADWRGVLSDAENLPTLADARFDVVVTRHLVWTLTDPDAAFREWERVLKPGGMVLIVDGDWAGKNRFSYRVKRWLAARLGAGPRDGETDVQAASIRERLFYAQGLTAARLCADLERCGFYQTKQHSVARLYGRGMRHVKFADKLRMTAMPRFGVTALKLEA